MGDEAPSAHQTNTVNYVNALPNELLAHIFSLLDSPQPSAAYLLDEPRFDVTLSDTAPLKATSLVSRRWRQAAIPLLFKHTQCAIHQKSAPPNTLRSMVRDQIHPFYTFVATNKLQRVVSTLTLLVYDKKICYYSEEEHRPSGFSKFWSELFSLIDPEELLIVAPSEALGALTSCETYTVEDWAFDCPCQYLRLQRPKSALACLSPESKWMGTTVEKSTTSLKGTRREAGRPLSSETHSYTHPSIYSELIVSESVSTVEEDASRLPSSSGRFQPRGPSLWQIRPWSSLLLNEGSFIKAYSTYEFWLRHPPSILLDLLGERTTDKAPMISPSIKDFSYIGLFPMSHHFGYITSDCPRVDRLYIQLVPRSDILQQKSKMVQIEAEDLWMERNSCYALLMRELFSSPPSDGFKNVRIFESGDAADEEAWLLAVEYVKRNSNGWKIAGQGVFVKDPKDLKSVSAEDVGELSAFEGSLLRMAFNGTAKLPVSAYPIYNGN